MAASTDKARARRAEKKKETGKGRARATGARHGRALLPEGTGASLGKLWVWAGGGVGRGARPRVCVCERGRGSDRQTARAFRRSHLPRLREQEGGGKSRPRRQRRATPARPPTLNGSAFGRPLPWAQGAGGACPRTRARQATRGRGGTMGRPPHPWERARPSSPASCRLVSAPFCGSSSRVTLPPLCSCPATHARTCREGSTGRRTYALSATCRACVCWAGVCAD